MTTAFDARFYVALLVRRLPYVLLLIAAIHSFPTRRSSDRKSVV